MLAFLEKLGARFRKRRAIRTYLKKLGPALVKRYGKERSYTWKQVKATIDEQMISSSYDCYAFAMYCDRADFTAYHEMTGESCDLDAMRSWVSEHYFGGHHFSVEHAMSHGDFSDADAHWHHDGGGHHDSSSHHDGGFDGGGHHH